MTIFKIMKKTKRKKRIQNWQNKQKIKGGRFKAKYISNYIE